MNHYYESIHGWFNYEQLYKEMVERFPSGRFVEVGCWLGRSACYMGVEIINSGKDIKLDCVDTWAGAPELMGEEVMRNGTLYDDFINNIHPIREIVTPKRMTSIEAAKKYEDESVDFVFLDGDHSEFGIKSDLKNWLPKIKAGGVIAGHDYDYPQIGEAVRRTFDRYTVIAPNTWVHYKQ